MLSEANQERKEGNQHKFKPLQQERTQRGQLPDQLGGGWLQQMLWLMYMAEVGRCVGSCTSECQSWGNMEHLLEENELVWP